jgi:hypothetical protein
LAARAVPDQGRANGTSGNSGFRKRRIDDPLGTEFIQQTPGSAKNPAAAIADGNVFTNDKYIVVSGHFLGERLVHRIQIK